MFAPFYELILYIPTVQLLCKPLLVSIASSIRKYLQNILFRLFSSSSSFSRLLLLCFALLCIISIYPSIYLSIYSSIYPPNYLLPANFCLSFSVPFCVSRWPPTVTTDDNNDDDNGSSEIRYLWRRRRRNKSAAGGMDRIRGVV